MLLDKTSLQRQDGHAWKVMGSTLPGAPALGDPLHRLQLYEDGRLLGPSHSSSRDISLMGGGRYAVWPDRILFSTSDNSDPTTNDRRYDVVLEPIDLEQPPFPTTAHVGITSSCNLTCRICRAEPHPPATLTAAHIDRIIHDIMPHLRWMRLDVTGEPLLHKAKFFQLTDAAERQGVSVFLCTNATLIDQETADRICANRAIKMIQISIDTPNRERLEWVRRNIRYQDFMAGVTHLAETRRATGRDDLRLHFHAALLLNTIGDLPDLVRLAHRMGVERVTGYFGFIQTFMDPALSVFWDRAGHDAKIDEAAAVARSLGIDFLEWGRFQDHGQAPAGPPATTARQPCTYLYQWCYVDPQGLIGPCCIASEYELGNLGQSSFQEIWHGARYRELRRTHNTDQPACAKCAACYLEADWDKSRYQPFFAPEHWPYVEKRLAAETPDDR